MRLLPTAFASIVSAACLLVADAKRDCIITRYNWEKDDPSKYRTFLGQRDATVQGLSSEKCIDACATSDACVAFTWLPGSSSVCTTYSFIDLKYTYPAGTDMSANVPPNARIAGRCGASIPPELGRYAAISGYSYDAATPEICSYVCENWDSTGRCDAYTWTSEGGGQCFAADVENSLTGPFDGSVVSGQLSRCRAQVDVEIIGADLAQVAPRPDWRLCCNECKRASGCRGATWTSANGGTCWLKKNFATRSVRKGSITSSFYFNLH